MLCIFLRLHRPTKNLKTNPHSDKLPYLLGETPPCDITSPQQCLWLVATRTGQPVKNKHNVNTTHIYVYLFSLVYFNNVHIITKLYKAIKWHLKCLYSYGTFVSVMFTVHFLLHLLWQCKHMFPMPIKPFELRESRGLCWMADCVSVCMYVCSRLCVCVCVCVCVCIYIYI